MESGSAHTPLKVCRHCSVASRTDADACPSCGRAYARPRIWRWWLAVPIVALAFAVGFLGRKAFQEDSGEAGAISLEQARAVKPGLSQSELVEDLGGLEPALMRSRGGGAAKTTCLYYLLSDREDTAWRFCFSRDELFSSGALDGSGLPD